MLSSIMFPSASPRSRLIIDEAPLRGQQLLFARKITHLLVYCVRSLVYSRTVVGCNSNIRLYRYCVGQRFGKHIDESVEDENGNISQWTVLIYLNGGGGAEGGSELGGEVASEMGGGRVEEEPLRGGETIFYKVWRRF